jgi:hypothetical protein
MSTFRRGSAGGPSIPRFICRSPGVFQATLLLAFLLAGLLSACARTTPVRTVRRLAPRWIETAPPPDLDITIQWASPAERRDLVEAADPAAWIEQFWRLWDPSPGTERNELREVLRQRADVLAARFPGTPLAEVTEPWATYFYEGLWSQLERVYSGFDEIFHLSFSLPATRRESVTGGDRTRGNRRRNVPSLDRVRETLQDPMADAVSRSRALGAICWYELPEIGRELLALPPSTAGDLGEIWERRLILLAQRMSLRFGVAGVRRLAALTALREPPEFVLRRAAGAAYSEALFRQDLRSAQSREQSVAFVPIRAIPSPHPWIWTRTDSLFVALATRYPEPESPTGWSWQGDVTLAMGPPALFSFSRSVIRGSVPASVLGDAYYLFGRAVVQRIRTAQMGYVAADQVGDLIQQWAGNDPGRAGRRAQAESLARSLGRILERSGGDERLPVTAELLTELTSLLPPTVYEVGLPGRARGIPIQARAVLFPASGGVDIQVSLGILVADVEAIHHEGRIETDLMTNCALIDDGGQVLGEATHRGGSVLEEWEDLNELPHLVDVFSFRTGRGRRTLYISALDPRSDRSGGAVVFLPERGTPTGTGPRLSDVVVAGQLGDSPNPPDQYSRGGWRVVPYPGNTLFYEEPLAIYFEIHDLARSDVGDYVWEEMYYIVPEHPGQGILRIPSPDLNNQIRIPVQRGLMLDLNSLRKDYEGPVILLVVVRDRTSGNWGASAVRISLTSRGGLSGKERR